MTNIIGIQTAEAQDFEAIASLNIEAYREYAQDLSEEHWLVMRSRLSAIDKVSQLGLIRYWRYRLDLTS